MKRKAVSLVAFPPSVYTQNLQHALLAPFFLAHLTGDVRPVTAASYTLLHQVKPVLTTHKSVHK